MITAQRGRRVFLAEAYYDKEEIKNMKKIIALVLALVMVLSLGTVASAKTARGVVVTNVVTKLLEGPAKSLGAVMKFNKTATVNAVNALAPVVVNNAKNALDNLGNVVADASWLVQPVVKKNLQNDMKEAVAALEEAQKADDAAQKELKDANDVVNTPTTGTQAVYDLATAALATAKEAEAAAKALYEEDTTDQTNADAYIAKQGETAEAQRAFDDAKAANDAAAEILDTKMKAAEDTKKTLEDCKSEASKIDSKLMNLQNNFAMVRTVAEYADDYIFEIASVQDLAVGTAKVVRYVRNFINNKVKTGNTDELHVAALNIATPRIVVSELIPEALQAMVLSLDDVSLKEFVDPDLDTYEVWDESDRSANLQLTLNELDRSGKSYVATLTGEVIDAVSDILTTSSSYKPYEVSGTEFTRQGGVITMLVGYLMGLNKVTK